MSTLKLGRQICGDFATAAGYEWLVTNNLGGYACGTVAGANTRRYHGFLMASLAPPVARTLLVAKVDLSVDYLGLRTDLSSNEFADGTIGPRGFVHLESFTVQDGIPTWRYAIADAVLEQQIFMAPGLNTSYLRVELLRASAPLKVTLRPYVTYRDYHSHSHGEQPIEVRSEHAQCHIQAFAGARPFRLLVSAGEFRADPVWYWNFWHRAEAERGMDAAEDLLTPGTFSADLAPELPVFLIATAEDAAPPSGIEVLAALQKQTARLTAPLPKQSPAWIRDLAQASDQFVVRRGNGGASILAGYPWFADWGRDTMIALPGLTTLLGRYDIAAGILKTYAEFVVEGMLPNRFPDAGEQPEYNTADATLWLFHALEDYLHARRDPDLVIKIFPTLMAIIHAHVDGTRFGIHVDAEDGLLCAGEAGSQLTWMDAKQGEHAFTPRVGKPVEINALWLNALDVTIRLAGRLRNAPEKYFCESLLARASASFDKFWNEERACLYDVIDVNGGSERDGAIRPNQILAVALPYCALSEARTRAVVDVCARELLTSYGLRTLSPGDAQYIGHYTGDPYQRDSAYHMGTVWPWLLGPFALAHYRVHGDAALAQSYLNPLAEHVNSACLGTIGEIFDGDAPHSARGCFSQAWSVAEILRSWVYLENKISKN